MSSHEPTSRTPSALLERFARYSSSSDFRRLSHDRLMEESQLRISNAVLSGEPEEERLAARILDNARVYHNWENEHATLMRRIAAERLPGVQKAQLLTISLSLIHRKALFEYLRDDRVRGIRRQAIMAHFFTHRDYASAVVAEHGRYVQSAASYLCSSHVGSNLMFDALFDSPLAEYEDLLTKNEIYLKRTQGVGVVSQADAIAWGLVGPIARAAGSDYDVRKYFPYNGYETYDFNVPTQTKGDVYSRYLVRVAELRESMKICRQALERISPAGAYAVDDPRITPPPKDKVYTEMEALIQHFLIYSQGFTVPAGDAYVPVEGPRGEQGFYVVSDGSNRPWRVKSRAPSLLACQALERLIVGGLIADVIAVIGSIDVVMGDVDR